MSVSVSPQEPSRWTAGGGGFTGVVFEVLGGVRRHPAKARSMMASKANVI